MQQVFSAIQVLFLGMILSFDSSGQTSTKGVSVESTEPEFTGTTRAVIIGISNYQEIEDLRYADRDAKFFYNYMVSPTGGSVDSANVRLLLNEKAGIGDIVAAFEWLKHESEVGDKVFIYFSGHGDVETLTESHNGFLLTHNSPKAVYFAGAFPVYVLKDYLTTLSQRSVQVIFIADACRSGKLAGGAEGAQRTNAVLQQQWANEIKILSCQPGELSLEGEQWGGGRGVFSYHLIQGIEGRADRNKDGKITLSELMVHLSITVPSESANMPQNPIVSGDMGTTIAYVNSKAEKKKDSGSSTAKATEQLSVPQLVANLKPSLAIKYFQFKEYLEEGASLYPEEVNAYALYNELKQNKIDNSIIISMERDLASGLHNEAQALLTDYLNGLMPPNPVRECKQAAEKLKLAIEFLGEDHALTSAVKAKKVFFEARPRVYAEDPEIIASTKELLLNSIEMEPNAAYTYQALGTMMALQGDFADARKYINKSIELAPTWVFALLTLTMVNIVEEHEEEAIEVANRAVELEPRYSQVYKNLAVVYLNRYDKNDQLTISEKEFEIYLNVANMVGEQRDLKRVRAFLEKAVNEGDQDPMTYMSLASICAAENKLDEFLSWLKKSIELDKKLVPTIVELDPDMATVRETEEFSQLMKTYYPEDYN